MAKKKQQLVEVKDKVFEVIPAFHIKQGWSVGWENQTADALVEILSEYIDDDLGYPAGILSDTVFHETLNSFKGDSDNLKAFLFLDTAEYGGGAFGNDGKIEYFSAATKGKLIVVKGYEYSFSSTSSKKRRVLELVF